MNFPIYRPRRLRRNERLRELIRETSLEPRNFIYPLFVGPGKDKAQPISSMPGIAQLSVDRVVGECAEVTISRHSRRDSLRHPRAAKMPSAARLMPSAVSCSRRLKPLKKNFPSLLVITDVCLCEYTDHGHCGVIKNGDVDNDATLELLAREALSHAQAGADIVAPSDMMDGRVGAIRKALDENGFDADARSWRTRQSTLPVSMARSARPPNRTPQFGDRRCVSDGPGQRRGGAARGRARHPRRRRHRHGQTGAGVSRCDLSGANRSSVIRSPPTTSAANTR